MTTTPLPPLPDPRGMTDAQRGYALRQYTPSQMLDYATQARADLEAENKRLRGALQLIEHATAPTHDDGAYHENAYELARSALKDEK